MKMIGQIPVAYAMSMDCGPVSLLDQEFLAVARDALELKRLQIRTLHQADRGLWAMRAAANPLLDDGRGWEAYELLLGVALGLRLQLADLESQCH